MSFGLKDLSFHGIRGAIGLDQPLGPLTWLRVGGAAELLFQPQDGDDLATFLALLPEWVPITVIGFGSNLLIRDGGLAGAVIRLSPRGFGGVQRLDDRHLQVGAAVPDKMVAQAALDHSLSGFAFYAGIPGAIGGALRMNAGAHGAETAERVVSVDAITRAGQRVTLSRDALGYSYRHSSAADDLIFVSAVLQGVPGDAAAIRAEMDGVIAHREAAQPIRARTGGSTFKNPAGHSAWKLIDAAGCRGLIIGAAQISEMHCNFMLNISESSAEGAALCTAYDMELLGETVRARVLATSGHRLEWEIKRLGAFLPGLDVTAFLGS